MSSRPLLSQGGRVVIQGDIRIALVPISDIAIPDNMCAMDVSHVNELSKILIGEPRYMTPPLLLLERETDYAYWLIEGRHRFLAHIMTGRSEIMSVIARRIEIL